MVVKVVEKCGSVSERKREKEGQKKGQPRLVGSMLLSAAYS